MKISKILPICLVLMLLCQGCEFFQQNRFDLKKTIQSRPAREQHIFDYADILKYSREGREKHFAFFKEKYGIDMIVVTIPSLQGKDISDIAARMFSNWGIGRDTNGKGILVLLSKNEKLVKIEVGYGVEGIFTDLFCGYVEKKQLESYLAINEVDFGFSAVMEEFIMRAEGKLTDEEIRERIRMADRYLSGGAGIKKQTKLGEGIDRKKELPEKLKIYFSAQPTPEETFARYVESFKKCLDPAQLNIYTEEGMIYQSYYPPLTEGLCDINYKLWSNPHEIKTRDNYAVVLFIGSDKAGPVFLKKTFDGWKIDYIGMRKWVRYTYDNNWYVCGTDHAYMFAFDDNSYAKKVWDYDYFDDYPQASPIDRNYTYYISILRSELQQAPDDLEKINTLAGIFFDLTLQKEAVPLLQKAVKLDPEDPRPYLYLGLINRDYFNSFEKSVEYFKKAVLLIPDNPYFYQCIATAYWQAAVHRCLDRPSRGNIADYKKAAEYMEKYIEFNGDPVFGYYRAAYFYFYAKDYSRAENYTRKVLELDPENEMAEDMLRIIEKKI